MEFEIEKCPGDFQDIFTMELLNFRIPIELHDMF